MDRQSGANSVINISTHFRERVEKVFIFMYCYSIFSQNIFNGRYVAFDCGCFLLIIYQVTNKQS